MHFSILLLLLSSLLFSASPLLAIPLTTSSQSSVLSSLQSRHEKHHPRVYPAGTITFNSITHRTRFTMLTAFYPLTSSIVRTVNNIYFEIMFNLSAHGKWTNVAPMSRVLLQSADVYLIFLSEKPNVPVPWELIKEWAEAMDNITTMGGFVGTYTATFERLVGDRVVDFWIHMGIGSPPALAAAAAKRKRVKGR